MKACIVTVYNSENCGSFWQAFALKSYLEMKGYEVQFLKRNMKGASHTLKKVLKRAAYALKKGQLKRTIEVFKQYTCFSQEIAAFNVIDVCDESFDICVLGSDTIWNLEWKYFAKERETYWGNKSKAVKTIAYAASMANTDESMISKYPEVIDYLGRLDAVGVRDAHTLKILEKYHDDNISLVCDPTLLFDQSFYKRFCKNEMNEKYIFVYYFNKMPDDLEDAIRKFAKKKCLKIVVMGNSMKGDVQYYAFSPRRFIECFSKAQFVVTNTYHGTIFSVIFEKPTLFNSEGKNKVKDLLTRFGLQDRDYGNINNLEEALALDCINYNAVNCEVLEYRNFSRAFIDRELQC